MFFLSAIVFGFIVFVILYARYLNVSGNLSKRKIQIDNLRDQVEFRVKKLRAGTDQINKEIADAKRRLEDLELTMASPAEVKMILELLLAGAILVLALVINKMIANWHDETVKAYRLEESNLRRRLASAIEQQKKALLELRDIKAKITMCESQVDEDLMNNKF